MPLMPGTNLTRDEAQPAPRCSASTPTPSSWTSRPATRPSPPPPPSASTAPSPVPSTFADLVGATVHEITLNGTALDPADVYADNRIRAERPRGRQRARRAGRLPLLPHRRGPAPLRRPRRRPGLPLHPVRGARRPPRLHHLRAARPQGVVHLPRDRAEPLDGRLERPDARARARWATARPSGGSPTTERMSTYITALVAGEYHAVYDTYQGKHGEIPLGHYCRQSLVEHLDIDELVKLTEQGFEFFEDAFDFPYPFDKYDQLYVPEYNMGAMENAGCVTLRDEYLPRSRQDRAFYEFRGLGDPARDGAHVVRRPGHDEVVGRPLAQRVLRRVGLLPRRRRGHRVRRVLDRLHQRPQELGATPGPAAQHPPDRGGQLRPAGRRGQLRRHHLRQGRLGAQAAGRLGRPGATSSSACAATSRTTSSGTPSSPTCSPRSRSPRAASSTSWAKEWLQTTGVNTLTPEFELDADGSYSSFAVRQTAPVEYPTLRRHRIGIGLYDESGRPPRAAYLDRDRRRGRVHRDRGARRPAPARPAAAQRRRPHLRQDPPRRALAGHRGRTASPGSTTRSPAPCAGAPRGT